ncbi:MAG: IS110 family transposase [Leptospiraceae bacterium]|nr:IS110 family transposase [Leptospiraceae bacterium]MCP5502194.1 IS110 family transposase [Leptospiraceae bacterium]
MMIYEEMILNCKNMISKIEDKIKTLIESEPELKQTMDNIKTIPGVGNIFTYYLLVTTNGFKEHLDYRKLASYMGIVPLQYESGKSIRRKTSSSGIGPGNLRRVIYLVSMASRKYDKNMEKYFLRKVAEGKNKKLVLNNIGNKLLKIIIALIKSNKPYIKNFVSIHPKNFKTG